MSKPVTLPPNVKLSLNLDCACICEDYLGSLFRTVPSSPSSTASERVSIRSFEAFPRKNMIIWQNGARGSDYERMRSSTNLFVLLLQSIPMGFLWPFQRALEWTFLLWFLSQTRFWQDNVSLIGRLSNQVLAVFLTWATLQLVSPLIAILAKWIIIGRYREGVYPMWGTYHIRWWMAQKVESLCGLGILGHHNIGRILYYRLMGAKIGSCTKIMNVKLGEYDLLTIGRNVKLNGCICRPFSAEENTSMLLGRINIEDRASVGVLSVIAPGAEIPPDANVGINSSSWEEWTTTTGCPPEKFPKIQDPPWFFTYLVNRPLQLLMVVLSFIPWLSVICAQVYEPPVETNLPLRAILDWFSSNPQVAYQLLAVVLNNTLSPCIYLGFVVCIQFATCQVFGQVPLIAPPIERPFLIWRATLIRSLISTTQLSRLNEMLGQHHEARSAVFRMLGAKVGKRVRWPHEGPFVVDFHLLNIGDDVTFGSCCHLLTSDEESSGVISIANGAVIGDHVCVLPGVSVGERAILGFGSSTQRGASYPDGQIIVGDQKSDVSHHESLGGRLWASNFPEHGTHKLVSDSDSHYTGSTDTLVESFGNANARSYEDDNFFSPQSVFSAPTNSPFNRALRMRRISQALPPEVMLAISMLMTSFTAVYWTIPAMTSMKVTAHIFCAWFTNVDSRFDPVCLLLFNFLSTSALTTVSAAIAVAFVIFLKHALIGCFQAGVFDWDRSSYCQRWQLYVIAQKILQECYIDRGFLTLLTGTHWIVIYYRALGAKIGKDCAIYANGVPSLMLTETDLIDLGDRVALDDIGMISHIDRRGSLRLGPISIGNHCVLRSGSFVFGDTVMKDGCCLLEHTLVMPQEIISEGTTMCGRPAQVYRGFRFENQGKFV